MAFTMTYAVKLLVAFLSLAAATLQTTAQAASVTNQSPAPFPVTIEVNAAKPIGELKPIWRMFGADEPNYATLPNGRKLLGELGSLRRGDVFFRAHNLLCTGDGAPALK
ncbi:MAG: hypothetical protein RLY20_2968, partial [Verrucomicrobiota bacterium]